MTEKVGTYDPLAAEVHYEIISLFAASGLSSNEVASILANIVGLFMSGNIARVDWDVWLTRFGEASKATGDEALAEMKKRAN